jgi:hypothetical protein
MKVKTRKTLEVIGIVLLLLVGIGLLTYPLFTQKVKLAAVPSVQSTAQQMVKGAQVMVTQAPAIPFDKIFDIANKAFGSLATLLGVLLAIKNLFGGKQGAPPKRKRSG